MKTFKYKLVETDDEDEFVTPNEHMTPRDAAERIAEDSYNQDPSDADLALKIEVDGETFVVETEYEPYFTARKVSA